jgi:hypothetical protein
MGRRVAKEEKKGKGKTRGEQDLEMIDGVLERATEIAKKDKVQSAKELGYFKLVREGLKDYVQMSDIEDVRIVQTILTGYNRAVGRGGHPLGRMMLVHGKNQVGKSALALAILESFARVGFPCQNLDAEYAAEKRWYNFICTTPGILDKPVGDLDTVVEDVNTALINVERLHREKKMPKEIGTAFVVDTLTKLMPRDIVEMVKKEGIEKQYPIQALFVSTWMKVVIPLLGRTNSALLVVLQERQNMETRGPYDQKWKITLGNALMYDNCLRVRVVGNEKVKEKDKVVGMCCNCEVQSDKISGTTYASFSFFTSNGTGECPIGLDLVMEAAEEAKERGWMQLAKGEMILTVPGLGSTVLGKNMPDAVRNLRKDDKSFRSLVDCLNAQSVREVNEGILEEV